MKLLPSDWTSNHHGTSILWYGHWATYWPQTTEILIQKNVRHSVTIIKGSEIIVMTRFYIPKVLFCVKRHTRPSGGLDAKIDTIPVVQSL